MRYFYYLTRKVCRFNIYRLNLLNDLFLWSPLLKVNFFNIFLAICNRVTDEPFLISRRINIRIATNPDYILASSLIKEEKKETEEEGERETTSLASSWFEVRQVRNLPSLTACWDRCNYPSHVSSRANEENFRVKSQERQVRQSASRGGCVLCQFDVIRHQTELRQ